MAKASVRKAMRIVADRVLTSVHLWMLSLRSGVAKSPLISNLTQANACRTLTTKKSCPGRFFLDHFCWYCSATCAVMAFQSMVLKHFNHGNKPDAQDSCSARS